MQPEVSVVVPNYNHAPYLAQRIDSVLAQTCQDFELILLDDCSTDDSRAVIERYRGHPRVAHIVCNERNGGSVFQQWDRGIALARGRYVWIAESDDWCEPSLLDTLLAGMRGDPDCAISYCQTSAVADDGRILWQSGHPRLSERVDGAEFIRKYLSRVSIYNASMALWRRDLYPRIPRDFTGYRMCGDWMFWIALAQLGNVHISGKVLSYFRRHGPSSVSAQVYGSGENFLEEMQVYGWMYGRGLIGDREYNTAFKKKYREFWRARRQIAPELRERVRAQFARPASPKTPLLSIRAGLWWRALRGRA
ncbi:glycosyltransferase family 2 protein [Luteimonas aquatica]|uniref:glycosyltransferase family 2 protein n=1 Tax=Luteimonas aquatica TaxID=450364 RepID=UPI001F59F044|nr:glycosyltransferase [Luteimonas aquatica]